MRGRHVTTPLAVAMLLGLAAASGCRSTPPRGAPDAGAAETPAPPPPRGTHVALMYASNLRGEYEPCACAAHPVGGLARRATLVDRARLEADALIQVDAGDLTFAARPLEDGLRPPEPSEMKRRARLQLEAMARMGLDAFTPGEADLLLGARALGELAKAAHVPIVLANVVDRASKAVFPATRVFEAGGTKMKIGVFGVLEVAAEDERALAARGLTVTDAQAAVRASVAELRASGAHLVVGLFHVAGGKARAKRLAAAAAGIDVVVLGHRGSKLDEAEVEGRTRFVEAFELGKHVGRLDLHVVDGRFDFVDRGQRARLLAIREDHRKQLADLAKRADGDAAAQAGDGWRRTLEASVERETRELAALPRAITTSWLENRIFELTASVPDHIGVAYLVKAYDAESARRAEKGLPVGIAPRPATPSRKVAAAKVEEHESWTYGSNGACAMCHKPAFEQWKTTKHAEALATLARSGRDEDPACIGCHTTGYLLPGGTKKLETLQKYFANVGCESCHGPSAAHVRAIDKKTGTSRQVPASVCLGCHTPDQVNEELDYDEHMKEILGPGHGMPAGG